MTGARYLVAVVAVLLMAATAMWGVMRAGVFVPPAEGCWRTGDASHAHVLAAGSILAVAYTDPLVGGVSRLLDAIGHPASDARIAAIEVEITETRLGLAQPFRRLRYAPAGGKPSVRPGDIVRIRGWYERGELRVDGCALYELPVDDPLDVPAVPEAPDALAAYAEAREAAHDPERAGEAWRRLQAVPGRSAEAAEGLGRVRAMMQSDPAWRNGRRSP